MQENKLNLSMFKAYDIRTRSRKLTPELRQRLLRAIGRYFITVLHCNEVVLGRDARLAAPDIMQNAVDYFISIGIHVIFNPAQISTCQFYYSCIKNRKAAGIMITASHNPGEYIGLKLLAPGVLTLATGTGLRGGISCIKEFYIEDEPFIARSGKGTLSVKRYTDDFITYSMQLAGVKEGDLRGAKIQLDFLNGSAGGEISEALTRAGAQITSRNVIPNGYFPLGDPNPVIPTSIQPAIDAMSAGDYDFGFCYDGDGDRFDIMDKEGKQLAPAFNMTAILPEISKIYQTALEAHYFTSQTWQPHIYSDVKANPLSMQYESTFGTNVHIIRNGHSFIKEALRQHCKEQYIAASEESAHYYFNSPFDLNDPSQGFAATENTLFYSLITAKVWFQNPQLYTTLFTLQESLRRIREWPCHFLDESKMEDVMQEVENLFRSKKLTIIKTMEDGSSLDATLMRSGIPSVITKETDMSKPWFQIAQRISRSEEGMTRWEIVSNKAELAEEANRLVKEITDKYVKAGYAEYL